MLKKAKLSILGIGPGAKEQMTLAVHHALETADLIVGYRTYIDLIRPMYPEQIYYETGMMQEIDRCLYAIEEALKGYHVCIISSGDSGIYGMAGIVYELIEQQQYQDQIEITVLPGVTSASAAAALLGAPLMHDTALISLSDLMTPIDTIFKRVEAAAQSDLVTVFYNPKSKKRSTHLAEACRILMRYRSPQTPCGIVRQAYRPDQSLKITTLSELSDQPVDMLTTVVVGNRQTKVIQQKLVTPRGYAQKYTDVFTQPAHDIGVDMPRLLIIGGHSAANRLVIEAYRRGLPILVSVASTEGQESLEAALEAAGVSKQAVRIRAGRLDADGFSTLIDHEGIWGVLNAAHPFASVVTETVECVAQKKKIPCWRYLRPQTAPTDEGDGSQNTGETADDAAGILHVESVKAAIAWLQDWCQKTDVAAKIFLTTGSKDLPAFTAALPIDRIVARVLPVAESLAICSACGLKSTQVVAMQAPFDMALNKSLFQAYGAGVVVTKASGMAGGVPEKLAAIQALGLKGLVIDPPNHSVQSNVWCKIQPLLDDVERYQKEVSNG